MLFTTERGPSSIPDVILRIVTLYMETKSDHLLVFFFRVMRIVCPALLERHNMRPARIIRWTTPILDSAYASQHPAIAEFCTLLASWRKIDPAADVYAAVWAALK